MLHFMNCTHFFTYPFGRKFCPVLAKPHDLTGTQRDEEKADRWTQRKIGTGCIGDTGRETSGTEAYSVCYI